MCSVGVCFYGQLLPILWFHKLVHEEIEEVNETHTSNTMVKQKLILLMLWPMGLICAQVLLPRLLSRLSLPKCLLDGNLPCCSFKWMQSNSLGQVLENLGLELEWANVSILSGSSHKTCGTMHMVACVSGTAAGIPGDMAWAIVWGGCGFFPGLCGVGRLQSHSVNLKHILLA